jgi:hypothetical protein
MEFSAPTEDFQCFTMERPWINTTTSRGGLKGQSCVPPGMYKLERHNSEAHPHTWALVNSDLDVIHWEDKDRPNARCLVLIHAANYARELRGCIAPGLGKGMDAQFVQMVTSSKRAMIELKRLLPWDDSHTLEIR